MGRWLHRHRDQGHSRNQPTERQRRQPVSAGCSCVLVFLGGPRRPVTSVAGAALLSCFRVLEGSAVCLTGRTSQDGGAGPAPAQWGSPGGGGAETCPATFLDPGGRSREAQRSGSTPWKRSFCSSGQDRNGTVSYRGHRHRALIVRDFANETCRWQGSGHRLRAARSVADASGPRRAEETPGHGPLDRWKGQTS